MNPDRLRVLLAQDEVMSAMSLKAQLESLGHEVVGPAFDGRHAVELAGREAIDLAILDARLARLNGFDAAEEIARGRPVPIILTAGSCHAGEIERASAGPVYQILVRPFPAHALAPAIAVARARFLECRRLRGEIAELERRLEERKLIERAKGILMDTRGLSERDAYRLLQRESQNRNLRMADIARTIVTAESLLRDPPNEQRGGRPR